jgi:hypothetical protein
MNDLDKTLKAQTFLPKRPLRDDFTQKVLATIHETKHVPWTRKLLQWLHTKLGLTILTGLLLIGSTAAASNAILSGGTATIRQNTGVVVQRPVPIATQILEKQLPNGDRLVGYTTKNCQGAGMHVGATPNETMLTKSPENMYYDVPKGSPLTNDQLRSTLLAECEENISNNIFFGIDKALPRGRQGEISEDYTVTAITAQSVTVKPDTHYKEDPAYTPVPMPQSLTYTRFDPNLVVYDQSIKRSYSAIHVGDDVLLVTKYVFDPTVPPPPVDENSLDDTRYEVVEAVMKVPVLVGNPELFYTASGPYNTVNGLTAYRDVPCTTNSSGFCRAAFGPQ